MISADGNTCSLDVAKDLPHFREPHPLYLDPDSDQYWLPNRQGKLLVPHNAVIELYCATSFDLSESDGQSSKITDQTTSIFLRCSKNNAFRMVDDDIDQVFIIRQILCKRWVHAITQRLDQPCGLIPTNVDTNNNNFSNDTAQETNTTNNYLGMMYRIGYNISATRFIETLRVCYNETRLRPLYVNFRLYPGNIHNQKGIKHLTVTQGGFFRKYHLNFLYGFVQQTHTVNNLYGNGWSGRKCAFDMSTILDWNKKVYLIRGHLGTQGDFIYYNQQRSTYNFFNMAPQWHTLSTGQWIVLEHEIHKYLMRNKVIVDCYVGSRGVFQLQRNTEFTCIGKGVPFYLALDENNNGIIPAPYIFFKILVDTSQPDTGIAFFSLNNPYIYSSLEVHKLNDYFCKDIAKEVEWLNWIKNDNPKLGYIFACSVSDFVRNVTFLPAYLQNVTKIMTT